jgi:transcriptional regulator with XRE-family HTH domain
MAKPNSHAPDQSAAVGAEIRALRRARSMTLADLAQASGVSTSHLSAIERGIVNPSLEKINRIAQALAVSPAWFFVYRAGAGPLEREYVVRAENRRNLNLLYNEPAETSGYVDWLLSSSLGGGFYMGMSEFLPGATVERDVLYTRDGEFHFLILEGELTMLLGSEEITMRAGDSVSIPGDLPHHVFNRSQATSKMIWVNSPVIIPSKEVSQNGAGISGNLTRVGKQAPGT